MNKIDFDVTKKPDTGARAVTRSARKKLAIFSRSGFEYRLKEYTEKNDIILISMEDLYE